MALYDFFISYTHSDRAWAEWMAWTLEKAGYRCVVQCWDFLPGDNFLARMQEAAVQSSRTVSVLSPAYVTSKWAMLELFSAMARDQALGVPALIPVRVVDFKPPGLLSALVYIDLVGLKETDASQTLQKGIADVARPSRGSHTPPPFPGGLAAGARQTPPQPSTPTHEAERFERLHRMGQEFLTRHSESELASESGRAWIAELGAALTRTATENQVSAMRTQLDAFLRPGGPLIHFVDWRGFKDLVEVLGRLCTELAKT
jgi:hypothetical protein